MRIRNEAGSAGDVVASVLVVIAILTFARVVFAVDLIGYLDAAVDWCVDTVQGIVNDDEPLRKERRG